MKRPTERRPNSREKLTIGLDGEGSGRSPHRYTLLAWSSADGKRTEHIANARGLKTWRCLEFLLAMPADARAFGFYLQYDWTMILKDLPNKSLYALFRPQLRKLPKSEGGGFSEVRWRHYRLHFLAGMMRIRGKNGKTVTIWDVGRFYQCAFVKALDTWNVGTAAERARIKAMKEKRSSFSTQDVKKIREYCLTECRLLAVMVDKLNEAHDRAGLKLRSWHGPGSTASLMLKAMRIDKLRGEQPPEVAHAAACAFFGGRFENDLIGYVPGPIEGWDIISAYPAELVDLPCLEHARWEYTKRESDLNDCQQACVQYTLDPYPRNAKPRRWGPLPCRMSDGTIVFAESGASGWTWLKEYKAARAWPQVRFKGAWLLRSDCKCQPFKRIEEWFQERLRVGKNTGVGLTLKLGYNSGYGKLAQRIGDPPFRCEIWAGMTTSGCRARILNALTDDVIAIATDGIYSKKHLNLKEDKKLGGWERTEYDGITLVRPGIYWTDSKEEQKDFKDVRARGLPRKSVSEGKQRVLDAIDAKEEWANLPDIQQFGGAMACIYLTRQGRYMRSERYGQWYKRPARIGLNPKPKRGPNFELWNLPNVESVPYRHKLLSPDAKALKAAAELAWGSRG